MVSSGSESKLTRPKVVISILSLDARDMLDECLKSVIDSTNYDNFEIVVVDNGSSDGTAAMVREFYPDIHLIVNDQNLGFSKGHNQAIERGKELDMDYCLLLNNDAKVSEPGWLEELVRVAEDNEDIGVLGPSVNDDGEDYAGRNFPLYHFPIPLPYEKYDYNWLQREQNPDDFRYVDEVVGAAFMIRREVIGELGGLDEGYSPAYWEESDYCVRVWDAGYSVAYVPQVEIDHLHHQTSAQLDPIWIDYVKQRNLIRFLLTNYPVSWLSVSLPFLPIRSGLFFVERADGGLRVRKTFRENPLRTMYFALLVYISVLRSAPDVIRNRRERTTVKKLLKE